MRVRVIWIAAVTLLLAGNLSANSVSLKATGHRDGKEIVIDRTCDCYFSEAFIRRDASNIRYHLVLNFGNNLGVDRFRWEMQFASPEASEILPGQYNNVARTLGDRKNNGTMYMSAGGTDNFLCDPNAPTTGRSFTLLSLKLSDNDFVEEFSASFIERCGTTDLTGTIAFGVNGLPDGGGDDGGGDDGGGTPAPAPPVPFQLTLPTELDTEPLLLTNSGSNTVSFRTIVDESKFNGDLHLSVATDAAEHEDFHASLTPSTIAAPGNGDAKLTITTGPLTFPRVYQVMLTATGGDQSFSRTFHVQVTCDPPFILGTNQPKSITAANGSQVTLEVKPSGSGPFFYQWYKGFPGMTRNPVLAANESKLIFTTRETATYWVRVSNACGTVDSNPVTVTTTGALAGPARRRSGG